MLLRSSRGRGRENIESPRHDAMIPFVPDNTLEGAIANAVAISDGTLKLKVGQIKSIVDTIVNHARTSGLSKDQIDRLVHAMQKGKLTDSKVIQMVNNMIPHSYVQEKTVIKVISWISSAGCPLLLQVALVKWLTAIYDVIEFEDSSLFWLYPILFSWLKNDSVCVYLCELLYKMTKPEHVVPYRVKILVGMQNAKKKPRLHISALLDLYVTLKPDAVVKHLHFTKRKAFKSLGKLPGLIARVNQPQEHQPEREGRTAAANGDVELRTYNDIKKLVESFKGGFGLSDFLLCPLRNTLLSLKLPHLFVMHLRLVYKAILTPDTTKSGLKEASRNTNKFLPAFCDLQDEVQQAIPEGLTFLTDYLKKWDGIENVDFVLKTVQLWHLCPFEDLWVEALEPMMGHFSHGPMEYQCSFVKCLGNLYRHWLLFELPRVDGSNRASKTSVFRKRVNLTFDPKTEIALLVQFIAKLFTFLLVAHPDHPCAVLREIVEFYKMALFSREYSREMTLLLPPPEFVGAMAFSSNPVIVSQMCGLVLGCIKEAAAMKMLHMNLDESAMSLMDNYVMDLCNMLCLNSAFVARESSAFFRQELPASVLEKISDPRETFSICNNPAFIHYASQHLATLPRGTAIEALIDENEYWATYTEYLLSLGYTGLVEFLRSLILVEP